MQVERELAAQRENESRSKKKAKQQPPQPVAKPLTERDIIIQKMDKMACSYCFNPPETGGTLFCQGGHPYCFDCVQKASRAKRAPRAIEPAFECGSCKKWQQVATMMCAEDYYVQSQRATHVIEELRGGDKVKATPQGPPVIEFGTIVQQSNAQQPPKTVPAAQQSISEPVAQQRAPE